MDSSLIGNHRERRLKCDETLPTCQCCQRSGQVCKGLWGKTGLWGKASTSPQTLATSNTSPAANTRAMTANTQCGRSSAEAEPLISSSDPEKRQRMEPTWVESSTGKSGQGQMPLEPGASPANNASGLERGCEQDFILLEEPEGQKAKDIQDPRQKVQPGSQGGDYESPTFMVEMDHSKLSNSSKQTTSDKDLPHGANREGSDKAGSGKVVNTPFFTLDAC